MFATVRCNASYKQLSLRIAGTEGDLANDFTIHAMGKVDAGKYHGTGKFSHWIKKVFRRFADTALNELTWEKKTFCGLMSPDENSDTETESGEGMEVKRAMRPQTQPHIRNGMQIGGFS